MTRSIWKGPFIDNYLLKKIQKNNTKNKFIKIWSRRSVILSEFIGFKFQVYNGQRFINITVTEDMVGHKFGEFSKTRKQVIHKT
uniref:Small ribosomal subunit protein uS19m n=1 Tax=Palpitomonas bilix TaxID=652834 RepID=A0A1E1GHR3_9EUKA|nr:30S ribosomal protein S19 [Palpitomonas bilix]BAV82411.1 30S ribosomal protein S19 [Palpitomonas bilix]